jgi:putative ABC transport system permease protein
MIREIWARLRDRLRREDLADDLDEELRFHRRMLERDAPPAGPSHQLGNTTRIREETRDMWSLGTFDDLINDVKYALRTLLKAKSFTVAVVLTLALGIGMNTAIFSFVHAVLLRPLPYADSDRLVSVWTAPTSLPNERRPTSYPALTDWASQNDVFTGVGGYAFNRYEMRGPEGVYQARSIVATKSLYALLGATPLMGRLPSPDDESAAVVAISYRVWQQRYGGARDVINRKVILGEFPYTIIGVMPPGFHFPTPDIDLWLSFYPMLGAPGTQATSPWITSRGLRGYRTVARLKPGVDMAAAEKSMNTLQQRLGEQNASDAGILIRLERVSDDALGAVRRPLWLMLGAAGMVLLLGCANVAHLVLARTATRTRELALRRALGAGQARVTRQLLTESMVLALIGGAVGVVVAIGAMKGLVAMSPADIPRVENVSLNGTVLLFALIASVFTGLVFGVAPAFGARDDKLSRTLREDGRGVSGARKGKRMRSVLTSAEVAFALTLLVGAGLMIRSFVLLTSVDPGFRADGVAVFHVTFLTQRYASPADQVTGLDRILTSVRAIPGVTAAGASTSLPPVRTQQATAFAIEGDPPAERGSELEAVFIPSTAGFLEALGISVRGRTFTTADEGVQSPPVVIVSAELARRYFGDRDPINRNILLSNVPFTVIGVAANAPYRGLAEGAQPTMYVPFAQNVFRGMWVAAHVAGDPRALVPALTSAVRAVDPELVSRDVRPLENHVSESLVRPRFQTWLLGVFGALALTLAAVGIYGVIAYDVSQRTAEIGTRLALGAQRGNVVAMIVRGGMKPVLIGLVAGVASAAGLSRLMEGMLYGVRPLDIATFIGVSAVLALVAAFAAYVPAMRAARVDPVEALRGG